MEFLQPFLLPVDARTPERSDSVDLYPPDDTTEPKPAVLVVHGGPLPAEVEPRPRDWPVFQAYPSLLAAHGRVGALVSHRVYHPGLYADGADDVRAAVDLVRADPRVDEDRIGLWFFSGSGLLSADWLRDPPAWLRVLAFTYPLLAPLEGWPVEPRFSPVEAVANAGDLPIVLTRVGLENPAAAEGVEAFVAAAGKAQARLEIIDVPQGRHGFDHLDDHPEARAAIERAIAAVLAATH